MAEWTKAVDCKSIRLISYIGSNPIFFKLRYFNTLNSTWIKLSLFNYSFTTLTNLKFLIIINPRRINCFFHFIFFFKSVWLCTMFTLKTLILLFFKTLKLSYFFTKILLLLKKIFYFFRYYSIILFLYRWFIILPKLYLYLIYKCKQLVCIFVPIHPFSTRRIKRVKRIKKKLLKRIFINLTVK